VLRAPSRGAAHPPALSPRGPPARPVCSAALRRCKAARRLEGRDAVHSHVHQPVPRAIPTSGPQSTANWHAAEWTCSSRFCSVPAPSPPHTQACLTAAIVPTLSLCAEMSARVHLGTSPTPATTRSPTHCLRNKTSRTLWHTAAAEEALATRTRGAHTGATQGQRRPAAARATGMARTSGGSAAGSSAAGTRAACAARAMASAPAHRHGA